MGIPVTCPNGHSFNVKDKYAGKKGLCPMCEDRVIVLVPESLSEDAILDLIGPAPQLKEPEQPASVRDDESESVLDDDESPRGSTMSLVGASSKP